MQKFTLSFFLILALLGLARCGPAQSSSTAVSALSTYLNALVNKNEDQMTRLVCPDWQPDALLELDSFQLSQTSLQGLACNQTGSDAQAALVTCRGKILAKYLDQSQEFDLSSRVYRVEKSGADWLVCGYTEK